MSQRNSSRVRRAKDPVRFVIIVGVVGAIVFGAGYFATDAIANQVVARPAQLAPSAPSVKVLSVRRAPTTLSTITRTGSLRRGVATVVSQLPTGSCFAVDWLGERQASVRETESFIPASSQKILTAAVALEALGAQHTFETTVHAIGDLTSGLIQDLYFLGGGDPVLVRKEYVATEKYPTLNGTSLEALADSIVAAGVRTVTGTIVGVDARYDAVRFLDAWPTEFNVVEAGPLGALVVNDGAVVGQPMKPDNPAVAAAMELRSLLGARGVSVAQDPRYDVAVPSSAQRIASITSAPLSSIVAEMLINSDNNTSELLLKEVGFAKKKIGSTATGIAVVQEYLAEWKLPTTATVADGSGLSSNNRMSCANFMALLEQNEDVLPPLLPVAGKTGTLRSIFEDSPVNGRLVGKTGTLNGVKALVGYLPLEGNEPVRFALIMNATGIDNQGSYRPIWNSLGTALNRARATPTPDQLAP